ncbi:AmmeMemoRadiSam system protein A [Sedimentibacter hydroxybenzoicus DSM 7310]|uniref:AmmeMemoRadiSam system protein A n=1 Tax=Sedimentibacter hydroxybenzoicus DSM 7310 TaxID=1123245 RepID=A0A974BGW4_SEDHY|nr:AmmeMemoRadiSam system protein A [Sedimentibacter hydroxybenzoicus DSM 7310]
MSIKNTFIVPHPPLIVPKVGRGQEIKIEETVKAYDKIAKKIAELRPDTIVVATPHSIMYSDYIHISPGKGAKGDFGEFGEPDVKYEVDYDTEFVHKLSELAERQDIPAGTLGERKKSLDHGTMVPLYFINKHYTGYKLVRIGISGLSPIEHYDFGRCIADAAEELNRNVVFIASGDLSHMLKDEGPYGYSDEGPAFDKEVTEAMSNGDFMRFLTFDEEFCEAAAECGLRSFIMMAGALDGKAVNSQLLSYEGPYGVGYAVASFEVTGNDENRCFGKLYSMEEEKWLRLLRENEDEYVRLARSTLESFVLYKDKIKRPDDLPAEMLDNKAGVFVSLKMDGQLRGCIGTVSSTTECIADEIIQNAISAGLEDPRFNPVTVKELKKIQYSVDVLKDAEPIESIVRLDTKKYGVIVRKGRRSGLLLPNLEGVDTPEEQVGIALKKAGIKPDEDYTMERFEVVRHN